jgi:hypothetical protein
VLQLPLAHRCTTRTRSNPVQSNSDMTISTCAGQELSVARAFELRALIVAFTLIRLAIDTDQSVRPVPNRRLRARR